MGAGTWTASFLPAPAGPSATIAGAAPPQLHAALCGSTPRAGGGGANGAGSGDRALRADVLYARGALHEVAGAPLLAEAEFARAVAAWPSHTPAQVRLAQLALQQACAYAGVPLLAPGAHPAQAAAALAAAPDARLLLERGLAAARAALRADPRDAAAWAVHGRLLAAAGRAPAAADAVLRALALQAAGTPLLPPGLLPWRMALF